MEKNAHNFIQGKIRAIKALSKHLQEEIAEDACNNDNDDTTAVNDDTS